MRRAKTATIRERHVIPRIDDILPDLHNASYFSKIDLRERHHQIELHEDSHSIMTFSTHKEVYQYKRLIYGVNYAFESFQKQLEIVLSKCTGAHNHDIIIAAT